MPIAPEEEEESDQFSEVNSAAELAYESRRGSRSGSRQNHSYVGPLNQCEPPSPAPSQRRPMSSDPYDRRSVRSVNMHRVQSTADISQYECQEEGAIRLLTLINLILLIAR